MPMFLCVLGMILQGSRPGSSESWESAVLPSREVRKHSLDFADCLLHGVPGQRSRMGSLKCKACWSQDDTGRDHLTRVASQNLFTLSCGV